MAAFAMPADVAARWRPLSSSEQVLAATLLEDASAMIRSAAPTVDARIVVVPPATEPALDPGVPKMIACRMVKRAMISGTEVEGVNTKQESAGALSLSLTYANPTGDLYLTKQERRMLGVGSARAFSVDLAPNAGVGYVPLAEDC